MVLFAFALTALLLALLLVDSRIVGFRHVEAADDATSDGKPLAVEKSMHEFMEYYFQPTYLRLKSTMAAAPADNQGWKAIKSDSLILAEGGNLLLGRKDPAKWNEFSIAVRESGHELYRFARKKDFAQARQAYERMLTNCNSCHKQFAGGKHILAP